MRALEFSGAHFPLLFRAFSLRAPSLREFRVRDAIFTTDDSSKPIFMSDRKASASIRTAGSFFPIQPSISARRRSLVSVYLCQYRQHRLRVPAGLLFALGGLFADSLQLSNRNRGQRDRKGACRSSLRAWSGLWIRYKVQIWKGRSQLRRLHFLLCLRHAA